MPHFLKLVLIISALVVSLQAQKINLLYDTQADGTIYPNSVWIVDMIKEIGAKHNIDVQFEGVPWSRALQLVKNGQADGLINASFKKERAQYAVYPMNNGQPDITKSLKAPAYYLYKHKDFPLYFDGEQLINLNGKIGAVKSYAVIDDLKRLNVTIDYGINSASNLNNVVYKKTIATAELETEADKIIKKNPIMKENLIKLPIPIRQKEYYLILSKPFYKQHKEVAETIWNGIQELKDSEKYIKARSSNQ